VEFPWPVKEILLQHHERLDGSGYPRGLKSEQIILEARILAVADVVEAMSSHRPYRPALSLEEALAEIESGRAVLYDPVAADACLRLFREKAYVIPA
jgi:HD-GYP domain-containing protein (c-di-GMP phosphodiesterase class II)